MAEFRFEHDAAASRYAMRAGDDLVASIEYRDDGRTVSLTRTFTVPTFRGHGYAGQLVDHVVADVEARGDRQIVPMCWYIGEWFDTHPERAGVLAPRPGAA